MKGSTIEQSIPLFIKRLLKKLVKVEFFENKLVNYILGETLFKKCLIINHK